MKITFTYNLLRYVHSQTLGEVFNIGILFFFPSQNHIIFKYPERLTRLKGLYRDFSESHIRAYQKGFEKKALDLNSAWKNVSPSAFIKHINEISIAQDFLVEDATALQFSETKHGVLEGKSGRGRPAMPPSIDYVVDQYFKLYFSDYLTDDKNIYKHDEGFINKTFQQSLRKKSQEIFNKINRDIVIASERTALKFDFQWKNGATNLIKSVGFDLSDNESINNKSILLYGKLDFLTAKAEQDNLRYDLLVSHPQERKLYDAYDKALQILASSKAPKRIITEKEYDSYADNLVQELVI